MKKTVLTAVAAVSLAAAAAPVLAQPVTHGGWDLARRESWLQDRIDRGRADGSLAPMEARRAQRQLAGVRRQERHLRRMDGGVLRPSDVTTLQARLDNVADHIRWLRHNDVRRPWA